MKKIIYSIVAAVLISYAAFIIYGTLRPVPMHEGEAPEPTFEAKPLTEIIHKEGHVPTPEEVYSAVVTQGAAKEKKTETTQAKEN